MDFFNTLPTELLDSVISYLCPQSVLNLSKTCRSLYAVALPHLYHSIKLTWKSTSESSKNPHITSLLRSVLANPILAATIKTIDFCATGFTVFHPNSKEPLNLTPSDVIVAKEVLSAARMPERTKWVDALHEQNLDAIIAVILSQCTNLASLSLGAYFLHANAFLPRLLAHALSKPRNSGMADWSKLEHVSLGVDMNEHLDSDMFYLEVSAAAVLPFLYFPALKRARVMLSSTLETGPLPWPDSSPPSATNLTELRLQRSRASPSAVAQVLACCPRLTDFEYDFRPSLTVQRGWSGRLDCAVLMQALRGKEETLKHLRICLQPYTSHYFRPMDYEDGHYQSGSIGSELQEFTALETLEVSLLVLLGWNGPSISPLSSVLPKGLETLTVRDDCMYLMNWEWEEGENIKVFNVFLKDGMWRDVCPELRFINLRLEEGWNKEGREKFKKMCNVEGIYCRIFQRRLRENEIQEGLWQEALNTLFD